ncbi:hypothetical protein ADUPG1_014219 [Aduncisulcus paluster]|uniref:FACT complex subunit SSRP1 n=1 Tax=Aduncisulcus paluster TaxID=2918883 RepID=A0ABQ5KD16_9EUKA|nr:hypothetical protein ADUPG1_014219 [Aduncisulcus paluster]
MISAVKNIYTDAKRGDFVISNQKIGWRCSETGKKRFIPVDKIDTVGWTNLGKLDGRDHDCYQLRLRLKEDCVYREVDEGIPPELKEKHTKEFLKTHQESWDVHFTGFQLADKGHLNEFFKKNSISFGGVDGSQDVSLSLRGWNWGDVKIDREDVVFDHSIKGTAGVPHTEEVLRIPLAYIAGVSANNNEISLKTAPLKTSSDKPHTLTDIRFYIPPGLVRSETYTPAEILEKILAGRCKTDEAKGSVIATFPKTKLLHPRGQYEVTFSGITLRFRGSTHTFVVKYTNIGKMFTVLMPSDEYAFIISLKEPVMKNKTTFTSLIISIKRGERLNTTIMCDSAIQKKYGLPTRFSDDAVRVYAALLLAVTEQRKKGDGGGVIVPGSFAVTSRGIAPRPDKALDPPEGVHQSVRCVYEKNQGHLFPLDDYLLFVCKPVIIIPKKDINHIQLSSGINAVSKATRISLTVITKKEKYEFSDIRDVYSMALDKQMKKMVGAAHFKNTHTPTAIIESAVGDMGDDEDSQDSQDSDNASFEASEDSEEVSEPSVKDMGTDDKKKFDEMAKKAEKEGVGRGKRRKPDIDFTEDLKAIDAEKRKRKREKKDK